MHITCSIIIISLWGASVLVSHSSYFWFGLSWISVYGCDLLILLALAKSNEQRNHFNSFNDIFYAVNKWKLTVTLKTACFSLIGDCSPFSTHVAHIELKFSRHVTHADISHIYINLIALPALHTINVNVYYIFFSSYVWQNKHISLSKHLFGHENMFMRNVPFNLRLYSILDAWVCIEFIECF